MTEDAMADNCTLILKYLIEQKKYLQSDFSVWHIATALNIPPCIVSQSLNRYLKRNFFDIINQLRIEEGKRFLSQGMAKNISIDGIAKECGFRSRSSFYTAFKKYEGCTPATWLKKCPNKM